MLKDPSQKYRPFPSIDLPNRQWPTRQLTTVPVWCSTDLRDGNQALFEPMSRETKKRLFKTLVGVGLKEIEVGFPSASDTDFQTVRDLIEQNLIPDDVTIMVITQAREELIRRTIESLRGARRAIVHVYNATAPVWRRVVFGMSVPEVMQLISKQVGLIKQLTDAQPETEWVLEYSPETFSMTELAGGARGLQHRDARLGCRPRPADHHQSADDGRKRDAEHLCRSDRMDVHAPGEARARGAVGAHA